MALNLAINHDSRRRPELLLFMLICVFCGYSFSILYFLPRYLLAVLPYFYLLGAWSLLNLVKPLAGKTLAAAVAVFVMVGSLSTQPFRGNAEFNLRHLDVVKAHKEMAQFIAREFPKSRTLTFWPHSDQLKSPELGYVKEALSVTSISPRDIGGTSVDPRRTVLGLISFLLRPSQKPSG